MAYTKNPAPPPNPKVTTHGLSAYKHGLCRCEVCRTAWREYRRDKERMRQRRKRAERMTPEQRAAAEQQLRERLALLEQA